MEQGIRILVADDDIHVHQSLGSYLKHEGYEALAAYDGEQAVEMVKTHQPDLLLLDIMMPKLDGLGVCREVRRFCDIPIIMLTAKGEEMDKLLGLELGADDYITKPFSPREVVARVKAVLRRLRDRPEPEAIKAVIIDNLEVQLSNYRVLLDGRSIACTPKEIEILYCLTSHPRQVFTRENLLESVWGYDFLGDTRAVDSHIKRIRAKLNEPQQKWSISTVWGVGYRFDTE